jgi:hypothetical protein
LLHPSVHHSHPHSCLAVVVVVAGAAASTPADACSSASSPPSPTTKLLAKTPYNLEIPTNTKTLIPGIWLQTFPRLLFLKTSNFQPIASKTPYNLEIPQKHQNPNSRNSA